MTQQKPPSKLEPMLFGRLTRVLFGIGTFVLIWAIGTDVLGTVGTVLLLFLGVSFVLGGLMGNPGCEITAIPNLLSPRAKRVHCT